MAPLYLRLILLKALPQSFDFFVKLYFFTNILVVCFVFVYIEFSSINSCVQQKRIEILGLMFDDG
jgi:hypothetical protein